MTKKEYEAFSKARLSKKNFDNLALLNASYSFFVIPIAVFILGIDVNFTDFTYCVFILVSSLDLKVASLF